MDRRTFLASTGAASTLALLPGMLRAQGAGAADAKLDALFQRTFDGFVANSPELATSLGLDKGANAKLKHQLSDTSPAGKARDRAELKRAITDIEAVAPAGLSDAGKLNREVVL